MANSARLHGAHLRRCLKDNMIVHENETKFQRAAAKLRNDPRNHTNEHEENPWFESFRCAFVNQQSN